MTKIQISKARQSQLAAAFRAGRKATEKLNREYAFQTPNPYADSDGGMPEQLASVRGAQWHAFDAGCLRAKGNVSGAGMMLRNARFCLCRATDLGRA